MISFAGAPRQLRRGPCNAARTPYRATQPRPAGRLSAVVEQPAKVVELSKIMQNTRVWSTNANQGSDLMLHEAGQFIQHTLNFFASRISFDYIFSVATFFLILFLIKFVEARGRRVANHYFDTQLEDFNSRLREREIAVEASLSEQNQTISNIQSLILNNVGQRHFILDQRKIEAAESVWTQICSMNKFYTFSSFFSTVRFDKVIKEVHQGTSDGEKLKALVRSLGDPTELTRELGQLFLEIQKNQIFVSERAFDLCSVYRLILQHGIAQAAVILASYKEDLFEAETLKKTISNVIPEFSDYVEQHGPPSFYFLLPQIYSFIRFELTRSFDDASIDKERIERIGQILRAQQQMTDSIQAPMHEANQILSQA